MSNVAIDTTAADPVARVRELLAGVKPAGDGKWTARCPAHEDDNASLNLKRGDDGRALLHCFAGCSVDAICGKIGLTVRDLFAPREPRSNGRPTRRIDAIYSYTTRDGELLNQVLRYFPKYFRQRRPNATGGWIWNLDGVELQLYRTPELMDADTDEWVFVNEGEKDADRVAGLELVSTCNAMGAGKWKPSYSEALRGRRVVIVGHNDDPGRKHRQQVAASLRGIAADVRILELPGLTKHGGDISDWLNDHPEKTGEDLLAMAGAAPAAEVEANYSSVNNLSLDAAPEVSGADTGERPDNAKLCTDIGNAARFAGQHGQDVRFCFQTGRWYVFNGRRWAADDRGEVLARAKRTALAILREAADEPDDGKRAALVDHCKKSQKRERLSAMIDLAKPDLAITTDELDSDPNLLNCRNGTVDLRTGELKPHRREDYITKLCRASYDLGAKAPTFQRFMARIFRTYPNLIDWLAKVFGYAATGLTGEHALFFLYGTGANGKTTLLDAIAYAMGDYADKADRELLTHSDGATHPTNVADLMGRRLVICSETNDGRRFDEARLKDLVGESRLKARFMRCDFFTFSATHKIFLYSNHRMIVRGQDHGFWRRMREVPFIETIAEAEKDTRLAGKLEAEADGILAWIVGGAARWRSEGLGCPPEVAAATNAYRSEMDSIGAFLGECCLVGEKLQATARDLYAAYSKWCEDSGERPLSQTRLGTALIDRALTRDRDSYTGRILWLGIGLRAPQSGPETSV